ncbi:FtsX-like permease family protein, partial [Roseivivax isoporae]
LYITARSAEEAQAARDYAAPRVDAVLPILSAEAPVAGRAGDIAGFVDHPTYRDNWPLLVAAPDVWDRVAAGEAVLVNEQVWRRAGLSLGDAVDLGADWSLPLAGVYSDYGNPEAQAMVAADTLRARYPDLPGLRFALRVDPDRASGIAAGLRDEAGLAPQSVVNQAEVKALSLDVFERTFLVTGALNALTLGVAGFAMLTSLLTLSNLRLPQLAPLWALGMTPDRLARLEVARTAILAALTWVVALPAGLALAWVLLAIVNVAAFGWRLPMLLFPLSWLWLLLAALAAALLASLWPVLRLTRLPPQRLLRVFSNAT